MMTADLAPIGLAPVGATPAGAAPGGDRRAGYACTMLEVTGTLRDRVTASVDISEEEAHKLALTSEAVQKLLDGREPRQVIYVKGRLVNIVL